jgi:hypothetical protein
MPPLWMLIDDIGRPSPRQIAKALDVTERTVKRWLQADQAPRTVMCSLFWLTRWGQHAVHCEAHNDAVMQAGMARNLRDQIERLQQQLAHLGRIADFGAANDPADSVRAARPTIGAPQLSRKTIEKQAKNRSSSGGSKTSATKQPRGLQRG